ncbi:hypothetical protein [Klebsiella pneumoniae]|nr:hypothetical protein [Klebsiella pneumoniae]MCA5536657.1 hypothetical protein [Klebsiella pneumoniae]WGY10180.1 hypothetical protein QJQ26_26905 [Klebsiella pneumoniae]
MYLVIAGIAEVFYAASMLRTEGFTRIYPSIFGTVANSRW